MELRPGVKLFSVVSDVYVVVVRSPSTPVQIGCGGHPMVAEEQEPIDQPADGLVEGPLVGKRYADEDLGLEVLCARPGAGTLTADGRPLSVKGAKPLPASD